MLTSIILLISIILDGILTNYLPYLVNDLSLFTPLLTVVSIFILYPLNRKKETKFFILMFIVGIIYDLLYTNLLFLNGLLFVLIAFISKIIYKNFETSYFKLIIYTILIIVIYESVYAGILFIYRVVPITIYKLFYKISHTLILNIIYTELLYFIIKHLPKKYKRISIN
ncbi:MAG: rod shape-determining protein MreD [Bacilli bacterium]|nr:rod shape-determining protein MreD [Bacilli bacterium]